MLCIILLLDNASIELKIKYFMTTAYQHFSIY